MNKKILKDTLGWGVMLWAIGYVLGMVLFAVVPADMIGWIIMPIGVLITLWVLHKKIHGESLKYYLFVGFVWALIAIVFDYFFLVKMLHPADGYYKLDVYIYYILTFALPPIIGWYKTKK